MSEKPEFFGSTTVGERGQIVLPAELRKKYQINAGDKLIVLGLPGLHGVEESASGQIMLVKAEVLNKFIEFMEQQKNALREILHKNEKAKE
jgi:AbrB family looped-hinge helix DNA binding protein